MADAQYVIDIAASMPAGEATIAQLDALTANLMGAGKGAEFFNQAIVKLTNDLTAAKAASDAANAALGQGQKEFADLSRHASDLARAAEKAAAANGGIVPADLQARMVGAAMSVDLYAGKLDALEVAAHSANSEQARLAQMLARVRQLSSHVDRNLAAQGEKYEKIASALGTIGGPLGMIGQRVAMPIAAFHKLGAELGRGTAAMLLGVTAAAALGAAFIALGVAAGVATVALAAWAISLADTKRELALTTAAVDLFEPAIGRMRGVIGELNTEFGLAPGVLDNVTRSLHEAKVSAEDMPAALRAAAIAERALGQGGANKFAAELKKSKLAAAEFSADVSAKLGGVAAEKMRGLDAQASKLGKNFKEIFAGMNIEPVLDAMQILVGMFDKNSAAGRALQFVFEKLFQPLIDRAETAMYIVEAFYLGALIGGLKLYIALKPVLRVLGDLFGFEDASLETVLNQVSEAAETLTQVFLVAAAVVGVVFAAALGLQVAVWYSIVGAVRGVINMFTLFIGTVTAAYDAIMSLDFAQVGADMMRGLAEGIKATAGLVFDALTGNVMGAVARVKKLLGIASPSKVFAQIGEWTGEGYAQGVDEAAPEAQRAVADLVSPVDAKNVAARTVASSQSSPSPAVAAMSKTLSNLVFNFYGVKDAEDSRDLFEEALTRALEGDAAELGTT
jgi:hypothetical protein